MKNDYLGALIMLSLVLAGIALPTYFVYHKVKNDSSIAQDTRRIADALDGEGPCR